MASAVKGTSEGRNKEIRAASAITVPTAITRVGSAISGSLSGIASGILLQPLDVLKTRAQALAIQGERSSLSRVAAAVLDGGPKGWKCIFRFWAGTQATVIRLGVGSGLHFAVLESIKPLMLRDQVARGGESHRLAGFHAVVAGALSRGITTTVMTPVTLVKTRIEGGNAHGYTSTLHALRTIIRTEGVRGLYRGVLPTLLTNAPYSGLYYMMYSESKEHLEQRIGVGFATNFVSSMFASVGATVVTQPMDVVRASVQLQLGGARGAGDAVRSSIAFKDLSKRGTRVLFAGLGPRFLKRAMQTAIIWTLYEELMPRLTKRMQGI